MNHCEWHRDDLAPACGCRRDLDPGRDRNCDCMGGVTSLRAGAIPATSPAWLGLLQDGDAGIGVFPEGEEILIGDASFGCVALHGVSAGETEASQRAPRKVRHHSSVVDEFLKFRCRSVAVVEHEIRFPTQINWE